jgi:hypothetical protein
MPLTVTEKEHGRQRIAARIERRIEALAAGDPGLMDRIRSEARRRAIASLGLAEWQAELDAVVEERKILDRREKRAQKAMVARLQGVPAEEVSEGAIHSYQFTQTVHAAVQKRQAVHEEELLAEHPVGRDVLRLRAEKENLLDVVWLASSPAQIKQLWAKVAALLGDEPSALEREALAIEPVGAG